MKRLTSKNSPTDIEFREHGNSSTAKVRLKRFSAVQLFLIIATCIAGVFFGYYFYINKFKNNIPITLDQKNKIKIEIDKFEKNSTESNKRDIEIEVQKSASSKIIEKIELNYSIKELIIYDNEICNLVQEPVLGEIIKKTYGDNAIRLESFVLQDNNNKRYLFTFQYENIAMSQLSYMGAELLKIPNIGNKIQVDRHWDCFNGNHAYRSVPNLISIY